MECVMSFRGLTRWLSRFVLLCLFFFEGGAKSSFVLASTDPEQLQKQGIAKIDHWTDYARRTGDAKSTVSELASAQSDLKTSYEVFLRRNDFTGASWSAIKLADVQRLMNQFPEAATTYRTAIELAKRAKRIDYQAKALARLAYSELQLGETDSAEDHIREAVRLGPNCGNKDIYFETLDVAGEIEVKRANLVAAAEYLDRALAMSGQVGDKQQLYLGYMDRADIYDQLARNCDYQRNFDICYQSLELARTDYQKALAITQELGYDFFSQLFRGFLKQLDTRKTLIQQMQRGDQTVTEAKFFSPQKPRDVLVTESFAAGGASPQNLAFVESAVKEMQDWREQLRRQGLTLQELNPSDLFREGQLAEMKGNNDAALTAFRRAVDLLEKDRRKLRDEQVRGAFMEDKMNYFYRPALLLLDRKQREEAFALFEQSRSRAMADMLASRPLTLGTNRDRTLFSQLQTLKINIAALQEKLFNLTGSQNRDRNLTEITRIENQIADLQQQYQRVETDIAKEAPRLKELTNSEPASLKSTQLAAREEGYDLLYYVVMEHAVVLWHINGGMVEVKNVFLPHVQLKIKTVALRDSLVARRDTLNARFDEDIARQLFLYLIEPVLSSIKSNHLIIVPQEELNSIPFQVLQDPETGRSLGERFAISYVPSATVLASLGGRANLKNGRLLAIADPGIHDAKEEVDAIGRLYSGRSKVVSQALPSEADLKTWLGDYNVVHLSVHGKFNASDPLLSYLQFAEAPPENGRFTAAEMFGLPLQKNSFVVLSACETGRVEATHANEVLGMVRSLLYAGAGNLVLSSWEVNAGSTRLWMQTFYREGQIKPPAEAARLALIAVKSRPEYSHPFFWAPFVMTGK
jgi:CHAT domain-containing protein